MILDGKIIPCNRCKEPALNVKGEVIDLWYSGKARAHGGNVQAVLAPDGFLLWVSDVEPGSVHDITAARAHAFPALYPAAAAGLPALADPGYQGAGPSGDGTWPDAWLVRVNMNRTSACRPGSSPTWS